MIKNLSAHKKTVFLGCFYMVLTVFMFGLGNALVKVIAAEIPVIQILFFRAILAVAMLWGYFKVTNKPHLMKSQNIKLQLGRGAIGFFSLYTLFLSFQLLPITDATALSFATPLFITMLSVPLLKEKVSMPCWIAVIIGFLGVSYMADPTGNVTLLGSAAAIVSAFLEGTVMILSRTLSKKDHPLTSVFYHVVVISLFAACFMPFYWEPVSWSLFLLLVLLTFISNLGQIFVVFAYSKAPAVVIAPILYTLIIWGGLFGYFFWGERLNEHLLLGLPVVILSGLYIIYQEFKAHKEHTPEMG
ncbi:MAG: DMT family transporter [Alphaproteobacteria bacterium]